MTPAEPGRTPLAPGPPTRLLAFLPRMARRKHRRRRLWPTVAYVALVFVMAAWGFRRFHSEYHLDFAQSLYRALKIYALDIGPAGGGAPGRGPNWQLVVAFLLAAALLVRAVFALLGDRLRRWVVSRFLSSHVIVCGAGVHGSRLARELAAKHDVVVIDVDGSAPGMHAPLGPHEWRLVGDALQKETLLAAGVTRASWVAAITGDAYVNSQIVSAIHTLRGLRDRLHVLVQVEDPSLARFLEEEEEGSESAAHKARGDDRPAARGPEPRPVVTPFSANAIAAEVLVDEARCKLSDGRDAPLLGNRDGRPPHLLLAGDHPLLDAIVLAALRRWHVRILRDLERKDGSVRPPLRISLYGPGAVDHVDELRRRWAPEAHVVELEGKDAGPGDAGPIDDDEWLHDRRAVGHVIVASSRELDGVRLTLGISRALGGDVLVTRVTTQPKSVLDQRLQDRTARSADLATTQVRAVSELASDLDEMSVDARQRLTRALRRELGPDAERTSAELFERHELRVHSDSTWSIRPGEQPLLRALLAPVPVSALVRARLAVELDTAGNLRSAAERLTLEGEDDDAFAAWCEYARHVTSASPDHVRAGLGAATGDGIADEVLRLRMASLDARAAADALRRDTGLEPAKWRVAIFAGGAASLSHAARDALEVLLGRALAGYDGLVFSGGTADGLPGLVGRITRALDLHAVGYVPAGRGDPELYPTLRETTGAGEFGVREPLAMWSDILSAGIAVEDVRVVACPGGPITRAEILLARALGAPVAFLDPAGDAETALDDALPLGADGVLELPADAMTLRSFVRWTTVAPDLRLSVARFLHADYRRKQRKRKPPGDPSVAPWEQLLPSLQRSNLHHADDIPNKLAAVGKRLEHGGEPLRLTDEQVELLAEMEHGRFTLERLSAGWELGDRRVSRSVSPYLVPWDDLDENTRDWDREAVRNIGPALENAGWGVADVSAA